MLPDVGNGIWNGVLRGIGNRNPTEPLWRVIELDPKYIAVIVQRWQAFIGGTATFGDTGQTFAEVAASRFSPTAPTAEVTEEGASA
jgi:hypothetical protein